MEVPSPVVIGKTQQHRPLSAIINTDAVCNLPQLHQSDTNKLSTNFLDKATIRESYNMNSEFKPIVVHPVPQMVADNNDDVKDETSSVSDHLSVQLPSISIDLSCDDDDEPIDSDNFESVDENCGFSTFPFVKVDDIEKHKQMNTDAETNSSSKPANTFNNDYLKRLKLVNRLRPSQKMKDQNSLKTKPIFKQIQTRPNLTNDTKDEIVSENLSSYPKPMDIIAKPKKFILEFKYSIATEDYYRRKVDSSIGLTCNENGDLEGGDEIKNGWLIRNLGSKVLNLKSRSIPSCNPIELRHRIQMARAKKTENAKLLRRINSRESVASLADMESSESLTTLHRFWKGTTLNNKNNSTIDNNEGEHFLDDSFSTRKNRFNTRTVLPNVLPEKIDLIRGQCYQM